MKLLLSFLTMFIILLSCYKNDKKIIQTDKQNLYQNKKSEIKIDQTDFQKTISYIIEYYNNKDFQKLNTLINPDLGIYFIYRTGTVDLWKNEKKICIDKSCLEKIDIPYWYREALSLQKTGDNFKLDTVKTDIVIECDSISKKGLFYIDNKQSQNLLSNTIKNYMVSISYDNSDESKKEIIRLKQDVKPIENWERNCRRIVLSYPKEDNYFENTFIFYVTEIDGKWYLSIIDFVSTDCSV